MFGFGIDVPGVNDALKSITSRLKGKTSKWPNVQREFFTRFGVVILRWIDRNFENSGRLVGGWRPLQPSTVFGRRDKSAGILQDTGGLRRSFTAQVTNDGLIIGSSSPISEYHQFGTRPYDIYPRNKKALAFFAPPALGGQKFGERPYGYARKGIYQQGTPPWQGGKKDIQSKAIVAHVHHPGLPARRMLPNEAELRVLIQEVVDSMLKELPPEERTDTRVAGKEDIWAKPAATSIWPTFKG